MLSLLSQAGGWGKRGTALGSVIATTSEHSCMRIIVRVYRKGPSRWFKGKEAPSFRDNPMMIPAYVQAGSKICLKIGSRCRSVYKENNINSLRRYCRRLDPEFPSQAAGPCTVGALRFALDFKFHA